MAAAENFSTPFHRDSEEPLPEHRTAAIKLQENIAAAQQQAAAAIVSILAAAGLLPDGLCLSATNLWRHPTPDQIVFSDHSYYGNSTDFMISIGFVIPRSEDSCIQLLLKNGGEYEGLGTE